ncbi:tRNA(m5U54)methyltransferase [Cladophialophora chaetospira]|uniref:tRNA(M5U54)methyltransferase n=1 Tax=Cladophialophora chaetospira TaxID=386627 RepID=A0AA38WX89_9EURO|nr:tRNA(m5U54)methyltransferase [Cladophialophora chaetospira]
MEKRRYPPGKAGFEKRRKDEQSRPRVTEGSPDQVLDIEATTLLERLRNEKGTDARDKDTDDLKSSSAQTEKPEAGTELQLEIQELSSTGDGLAYSPDKDHDLVFVVPFSVPGDKVLAKTDPQKPDSHQWMKVDFVKLLSPSPSRDGVTPQCRYFGTCSGCQLQMLPYQEQLAHKKTIIEKAFKHFSNLDPSLIPPVEETIGSPLQYGYRTKITPHYDGTHKSRPWKEGDQPPPFGFTKKNVSKILDIEQCPIATDILNEGLKIERKNVADTFWKKSTGATVLLRESTKREVLSSSQATKARTLSNSKDTATNGAALAQDLSRLPLEYPGSPTSTSVSFSKPSVPEITYTYPSFQDTKTYTSDHKAFTTEHIGPYTYTTLANSFFQNNNSILPTFLSYIRDQILPKTPAISATGETYTPKIKYLLDAYCGSGLFSIALASEFSSVLGIDIDALGIQCARENATINNPQKANGQSNLGFIAADATAIFEDVPYPADQTLCIIDPPRKGASPDFLKQLCAYGPKRVVYVSCNVHTQARDVGMLVAGLGGKEHKSWRYSIEKVGGFDFFPQTGHVEGVCFLNRVEEQ